MHQSRGTLTPEKTLASHLDHGPGEKPEEEANNERLLVFSDGMIAFALTVAAITIKIPANIEQLQANGPSILLRCVMYVVAFVIVATAWADHHTIFHYIKRNNTVLIVLNFFYLAAIVMFPIGLFFLEFGTELFNINDAVASQQIFLGLGVFLGSQVVGGLTLLAMWLYAKYDGRLLETGLEPRLTAYMTRRLLSKPLVFIFLVVAGVFALFYPTIALPVIIVTLLAREVSFALYRRRMDMSVGQEDTKRIQLFSDAVIGIAVTLAIAQIEFPSLGEDGKNALEAVNNQWPLLHAFVVGIVIMGVYWLFHYHLFRLVKRYDTFLIFLNCFFLLDIALMLLPVDWFVNYYSNSALQAYLVFGLYQIMTSLVLVLMWWHVVHRKRLLSPSIRTRQNRQFGMVVMANPLVFVALTVLSFFLHTLLPSVYIAIYFALIGFVWLLAQFVVPHGHETRHHASADA